MNKKPEKPVILTFVIAQFTQIYMYRNNPRATSPSFAHWLVWYSRDVIKGRWPEADPIIIREPYLAYHYAKDVIKGRWPEAESKIMKDTYWGTLYLINVVNNQT